MEYPAVLTVRTPERVNNWRPLIQWLLALPHLVVSWALSYLSGAVAVVSWFAIVFTGRLPEGLANVQAMVIRYSTRASLYAGFLHDSYPPFEFAATPNEPGGTAVEVWLRPSLYQRNRVSVGFRLILAIPALLYAMAIGIVGAVCWFLAFFAVLFTGRWPAGLHAWVTGSQRVSLRLNVYLSLLTDQYPPYSRD